MSRAKRSLDEAKSNDDANVAANDVRAVVAVAAANIPRAAEAGAEQERNNINNNSSSEEDEAFQTPTKKVRLNLAAGSGSSAEEETKAASYTARARGRGGARRQLLANEEEDGGEEEGNQNNNANNTNPFLVTPALGQSKRAGAAKRGSSSSSESELEATPKSKTGEKGAPKTAPNSAAPDSAARRTLFTPPNAARPQLITPSRSQTFQSPAKRRLVFGRYTTEIDVDPKVKKVYGIVRKLTGSIGGNASHGPIYGELTMGSMQKMVNLMKEHTGFDANSRFLDVGSGIGKPNFHVAHDPGVSVSYGLEVDGDRWLLSMNCLKGTLEADSKAAKGDKEEEEDSLANKQKCIFVHGDIRQAQVFDPFTHVYMFSIGFPPELWVKLAEIWNRSASPYLICFHSPKDIIQSYDFHVELLAQTPTSMHGSKEGHTGYVYKRSSGPTDSAATTSASNHNDCESVDPLFAKGIETVQAGRLAIEEWVDQSLEAKMRAGPATRTRRRSSNSSSSS